MKDPDFSAFIQHGHQGIKHLGVELLPPVYDAVWEMGHGFWGARQGTRYLVVAPTGQLVVPVCVLPACFAGYRMLDLSSQLAYAAQGSVKALIDLPRDFPGLRLYEGLPCVPTDWWAEQALPSLWNEDEDEDGVELLILPGRSRNLVLSSVGSWYWHDRPADEMHLVVCGSGLANEYNWMDRERDLRPTDTEQLLWWQTRCERLASRIAAGETFARLVPHQEMIQECQEAAQYEKALDQVLKDAGLPGLFMVGELDYADFVPYDEEELSEQVRDACYAHLAKYVELDEAGRAAAAELILLAWLFANDLVEVDHHTGWSLVDERYSECGIYDPVLDDETTPLQLYMFYELDQLAPLLRAAAI